MARDRRRQQTILDPWTYFDYKPITNFGNIGRPLPWMVPSWVDGLSFRRLNAYKMLESYARNDARGWIDPAEVDSQEVIDNRREYGDPGTVVDTYLASLIGSDQSIVVPDAEAENPNASATAQRDLLLDWADQERFLIKMIEAETQAVKLGDTCYVVGWDVEKSRPRLRVYDPGFYFPVLDEDTLSEEDFPNKVHIAYEYETGPDNDRQRWVRRITWEIGTILPHDEEGDPVPDPENDPQVMYSNESVVDGQIQRLYPWNSAPSTMTCFYSDAVWAINDVQGEIPDFDESKADWRVRYRDLQIDFLPVVHIPNTPSEQEHFGRSVLANVLQLFDDLVATDTDLQAASATTGTPPIAINGATVPKDDEGRIKSYGPGTVFETGEGGATMIDTSNSLTGLLAYDDHLLERLSVNARVPESLLGRIKPSEVPSGIALTLSFAPHASEIRKMRLVRKDKYGLLLKFVSRMYQLNGDLLDVFPANVHFGTFLPADREETINLVVQGLTAKAISVHTAVTMLIDAGFPITSALQEVQRIRADDFNSANELLNATGDINEVRDRLGLGPAPPLDINSLNNALASGGAGGPSPALPPGT